MKILFCYANPRNDLDLTGELENVLNGLSVGRWQVRSEPDVTAESLTDEIRSLMPDIVHFCGHCDGKRLLFAGEGGRNEATISAQRFRRMLVSGRRLRTLLLGKPPRHAIILNACQTFAILSDLEGMANWGIATTRDASDAACIEFTRHFYMDLSENGDVRGAFNYAMSRLKSPKGFHLQRLGVRRPWLTRLVWIVFGLAVGAALWIIAGIRPWGPQKQNARLPDAESPRNNRLELSIDVPESNQVLRFQPGTGSGQGGRVLVRGHVTIGGRSKEPEDSVDLRLFVTPLAEGPGAPERPQESLISWEKHGQWSGYIQVGDGDYEPRKGERFIVRAAATIGERHHEIRREFVLGEKETLKD